jgi:hypothetical protein
MDQVQIEISEPSVLIELLDETLIEIPDATTLIEISDETTLIVDADVGPQGATGAQGPAGPVSPATDATYVHTQLDPSITWTIVHNMGKNPSVSTVDSGGTVVFGDVNYLDINTVIVSFGNPFGGRAYLN